MILTTARPLLAVLASAALGACALAEAPPEDHFYRLNVAMSAERFTRPPLPGTLEVARLAADGLVGDRAVVYVVGAQPHEVFDYNYHFWNQAPGELVQGQLIRFLRSANAAERVVAPELRIPADYVVEGRIRRFDQVFADGVAMALEIELGLVRLADDRLLLLKTYRASRPAAGDAVPAAVEATNAALADIFAEFVADLRGARVGT